jgi:hypothetical protein
MAKQAAWKRPGSPIGKKGPRKANPKYKRRMGEPWSADDLKALKTLAKENTPTGVISLKLQRPLSAIRSKAQREGISLGPANRSPYNRRKTASTARKASGRKASTTRKASKSSRKTSARKAKR